MEGIEGIKNTIAEAPAQPELWAFPGRADSLRYAYTFKT
jgi:hypothetical protein